MITFSSKACPFFIFFLPIITFLCFFLPRSALSSSRPHIITFRSSGLHPPTAAFTWDPFFQHFLAGSLPHPHSILSISDAGVADTLLTDPSLPSNSSILGLAVDAPRRRLLAVVRSASHDLQYLASYDLRTRRRVFLAQLSSPSLPDGGATQVAVDMDGTAHVTDSAENIIWKVTVDGHPSVFSRSPLFTAYPVTTDQYGNLGCGLNGIAYVSKGYLLVVQSNTGKLFKVNAEDGTARVVPLTKDLLMAGGIVGRRDGVVVVLGAFVNKVWYLKSYDSWGTGVVYDETDIDEKRNPVGVATGGGDRVYVLYGGSEKAEQKTEWFNIEEIAASKEGEEEEHIWIFILIGLGLAYFWFWRFQMGRLFFNMNKKIE